MSFRRILTAITLVLITIPAPLLAGPLTWPVGCVPGVNCLGNSFYLGYPDIGSGYAFNCSKAGYVGHNGTDIIVSDVAGRVPVFAAADGEILWAAGGYPDRSAADQAEDSATPQQMEHGKDGEQNGKVCDATYGCFSWGFDAGNFVLVRHAGAAQGLVTLYAHLRNGSLTVASGQKVQQGEKIAEIGSSGNALMPHLHFGVFFSSAAGNRLTDPWFGECSKGSASLWQYEPPYRADIVVSKSGDGEGVVTGSLTDISCGSRCSAMVAPGTAVTLRAVAYAGSEFSGWGGEGCAGQGAICQTRAESTMLVTALFKAVSLAPADYPLLAAIGLAPAVADKKDAH